MSVRVTITHVRRAGWCVSGVRAYCRTSGIDFRQLCRGGIPVEDVEHLDDAFVQRAIEIARGEASHG